MSLTRFIDYPDVKQRLREQFPKPWFQVQRDIQAPPLTSSYGLTGTAFDYLLRFYLQKINTDAVAFGWVATDALGLLLTRLDRRSSVVRRALQLHQRAESAHQEYVRNRRKSVPSEALIKAAIGLAQLDVIYRAGIVDFSVPPAGIVDDLAAMLEIIPTPEFLSKRTCVLNPTFGTASELVGGADADLFIDGTLVDVKTSKHLNCERDVFNQLVGYYCLSCIAGVQGTRAKVKEVAVYFARFGILHRIPVFSFAPPAAIANFLPWFKVRAQQEYGCKAKSVEAAGMLRDKVQQNRQAGRTD